MGVFDDLASPALAIFRRALAQWLNIHNMLPLDYLSTEFHFATGRAG